MDISWRTLDRQPQNFEADTKAPHMMGGGDAGIDFMEKVLQDNAVLEEEDGHEDDRIPDLLKDLYDAEDVLMDRSRCLLRC